MRISVSGSAFTISNSFFAGQRQRSLMRHRRLAFAPQAHLEVRRKQPHFAAIGLHQHVGQDRNRVLALDDALKELQFSKEVVLADDEFHVLMTSVGDGGSRGGLPSSDH